MIDALLREPFLKTANVEAGFATPTRADPAVILTEDWTSVICWVELAGDVCHWFFAGTDGPMGIGPEFRGERTLDEIRDLVSHWSVSDAPAAHAT